MRKSLWLNNGSSDFCVPKIKATKKVDKLIFYHGFGIIGYKYVSSNYDHGNITFKITQEDRKLKCSVCKSSDVIRKGVL
ncbi:MAG: hypothetical protein GY714_05475 [Desulfobacterales bacterium]|nr:hypothetical protein [Desulfobacterales bacterium]